MDWLNRIKIRPGPAWAVAIAAISLLALILGALSHMPASTPSQRALNPSAGTPTAAATPTSLPVGDILARSRSAHFKDMSGKETIVYGDGGSTTATIMLTANPARMHEVDSQFDAQGRLVEVDDVIRDGGKRYLHVINYRTTPPTDDGWKLDPQPVPDSRPLSVFLLDPFNGTTTFLGIEPIGGVSTYHLLVQLSATSKQEVWIRADNFYFVQWRETDSFSHALITMTAWDSGLSITVPSV